jgi:hypothetical protein
MLYPTFELSSLCLSTTRSALSLLLPYALGRGWRTFLDGLRTSGQKLSKNAKGKAKKSKWLFGPQQTKTDIAAASVRIGAAAIGRAHEPGAAG